tara:strand:+ start:59 stop:262 length:204 start_codon:yes stop_codon:yes gene_type:complete
MVFVYVKLKRHVMKKIKISRPGYQIPLKNLLNIYRKELRSEKLNSKPSKENLIIEKNKIFFNHIGVG